MARRLDWDKARREDVVVRHGGVRAEPDRLLGSRVTYASDRQMETLREHGFSGQRPATAAVARSILAALRRLEVTQIKIDALRALPSSEREARARELLLALKERHDAEARYLKGPERSAFERAYAAFRQHLVRLSGFR